MDDNINRMRAQLCKDKPPMVPQKALFLRLPFKGDDILMRFRDSLKKELADCFPQAKLIAVSDTTARISWTLSRM
ncbi:hypothetical protein Ciccas_010124 [Cichlidogyrus casuarinus]|uniref:Uncharacterized protein n=1 Tax=Cichlidogyrus casuarinus TaxID=1844966 RepID=A0ABD2PW40_9PLAT